MLCRSLKGAGARIFRGHNPSTTTPRPWIKVRETATVYPVPAMESVAGRNIMDQRIAFSFTFVPMLLAAIALVASPALGQQGERTHHRYFVSAELTIEGMKNLQKQSATGLRAGVVRGGGRMQSSLGILNRVRAQRGPLLIAQARLVQQPFKYLPMPQASRTSQPSQCLLPRSLTRS
jgi:hypothetical protein